MVYNRTTTEIFRTDRYTTSGFALRCQMLADFGGGSGKDRLAVVLGITPTEASVVLAGKSKPDMFRLAYHYGFMPREDGQGWRVLPMQERPYDAGPRMRWTDQLIEYLRHVFSNGPKRPNVGILAFRMDTTEKRLRDAMRRHRILLNSMPQ